MGVIIGTYLYPKSSWEAFNGPVLGHLYGLLLGLKFSDNFFGLKHLTTRTVWKHSFLNVGLGCFKIVPPVNPFRRFVFAPFVNSRVGFKLFSLDIKHGIITEILRSTLSHKKYLVWLY